MRNLLKKQKKTTKIKPGDKVRLRHKIGVLDKGYYPNWTDRIETVTKTIKRIRKPYIVVSNESKRLYPEEVQKINEELYRVEKILKKRKRNGKTECLIKWIGYSDSYNSWEPIENVVRL